jgi:hypothetical protein
VTSGVSTTCRPGAFDLLSCTIDLLSSATQKSRPSIANTATVTPMPIPASAPVLSLLLELEEEIAVRLAAEELAVTAIDEAFDAIDEAFDAIDEVLDAMDVEVVNDDKADAVVFGSRWVTVRLVRMKYP